MDNNNNSKFGCAGIAIVIILLLALVGSCGNDSSNYNPKYSYEYNNDKEYRDNVNDIADIFGESPEDVDRKINDVVDAANNR